MAQAFKARCTGANAISRRTVTAWIVATIAQTSAVKADTWPSKPVRIICPFAAGGTGDVFSRILADHFSSAFKQTFFVDNRAGAGGQIGSAAVATASPDGYTLVVSGNASHVVAPNFAPNALYDGAKDFTHIAYLGGPPVGLLVHPSFPANTFDEFLKVVRTSDKPVDYASSGIGTHGFLFGEDFARKEKLRLVHIPYKGGGPAMVDLLAGHVKVATMTFSTGAALVRDGKLRALAISSERRLSNYPDIPTFAELGHSDMTSSTWFALSGPKSLPAAIVDQLNREARVALDLPAVQKRLVQDAIQTKYMSPIEVTRFFEHEVAQWGPLARELRATTKVE